MAFTEKMKILSLHSTPQSVMLMMLHQRQGQYLTSHLRDDDFRDTPELHGHCPVL